MLSALCKAAGQQKGERKQQIAGAILGKKNVLVCGVVVQINYIKIGIVYTVTASISLRAIQRSNCYHNEGLAAACEYGSTYSMLIFGSFK
ncbi:hypothetical protein ACS0TY_011106 [Phlomoides rotata]